jgi:hypothetical protein
LHLASGCGSSRLSSSLQAAAPSGQSVLGQFPPPAGIRADRQALWNELRPVALKNCTLRRFGSVNDGGYLMCENLLSGTESAYSYGIDTEDNWGCEVSQKLGGRHPSIRLLYAASADLPQWPLRVSQRMHWS